MKKEEGRRKKNRFQVPVVRFHKRNQKPERMKKEEGRMKKNRFQVPVVRFQKRNRKTKKMKKNVWSMKKQLTTRRMNLHSYLFILHWMKILHWKTFRCILSYYNKSLPGAGRRMKGNSHSPRMKYACLLPIRISTASIRKQLLT